MPNDWAPEPWKTSNYDMYDAEGTPIPDATGVIDIPDCKRIVACVNACAGVPTAVLLREAKGTESVACSCGYLHRFMRQSKHISHIRFRCRWCGEITGVDIVEEATDGRDDTVSED